MADFQMHHPTYSQIVPHPTFETSIRILRNDPTHVGIHIYTRTSSKQGRIATVYLTQDEAHSFATMLSTIANNLHATTTIEQE